MDHLLFDIGRDMSICGEGYLLAYLTGYGPRLARPPPHSFLSTHLST